MTALWNYAQHFAMSDNSYGTTFGPSIPGHINLISGQTHGANVVKLVGNINAIVVEGTVIGNPGPVDDCTGPGASQVRMTGRNVGDLLNDKGITWGWFAGGFGARKPDGTVNCLARHTSFAGFTFIDYISGDEPFQFYPSTANPHHLPPSSVSMIGYSDQANHQYDLSNFWVAANAGHLPAVSFLRAPSYQAGHPQSSDPLDEQAFLVDTVNRIQSSPQ